MYFTSPRTARKGSSDLSSKGEVNWIPRGRAVGELFRLKERTYSMKHSEVLVVTENTTTPKILNWKVSTVNNVETAIEKLQNQSFKVVAISTNMSQIDKNKLQQMVAILSTNVVYVEYPDEERIAHIVNAAYWAKNKPNFKRRYLDNSFEIKLAYSLN
ncbi:hypothetical protein [Mariniflexile rhizosphaerae]|uniref:hypothetical protein n=1 Tax=unclassified Mariniflexile TaxID=2643887 RepID=UPI0013C34493|nr:hypothetical protein [Mariniflexile sp. TRM1-10]